MPVTRTSWGTFPNLIVHSTLPSLQGHQAYAAAKGGDFRAARAVAETCTRADAIAWRTDYIVPVLRLEAPQTWSPLALALAERLALFTGARVVTSVVQTSKPRPSSPDAIEYLLQQPIFTGPVPKGTYLLVDESVSLGSTLANLRGYIETHGGKVAAASTFTARLFAGRLKPEPSALASLERRFGTELSIIPDKLGFEFVNLTHKEACFLQGLATLEPLRDPMAATHRVVRAAY